MKLQTTSPIAARSITDQIAEYVADQIISGRLEGNAPIREQPWAEKLGVSRGSVREALLLLERRHLVLIEPRKGARVVPLDARWAIQIAEAWFLIMGELVRRLPARLDPANETLLDRRLDGLRRARQADSVHEFYEAALELVNTAATLADHDVLIRLLASLMPAVRRCFRFALDNLPDEEEHTLEFAEAIVAAVEARDSEKIAQVLREFGHSEMQRLERALKI